MRNTATLKALQACLRACLRKQGLKHVPQIACCVRSQGDDWAHASARYAALGRKLLLEQLMEVPDEGTPVKRERSEGGQGRAFRPTTSSMPIGRSRARTPQRAAQMEDEPVRVIHRAGEKPVHGGGDVRRAFGIAAPDRAAS